MGNIELKDWITIFAIVLGPIFAVQVQKYLELIRSHKRRKQSLFQALMSTRQSKLSFEHVQALNMIDIVFYGRKIFGFRFQSSKDKEVIERWKLYHDHLNEQFDDDSLPMWTDKGNGLFNDLLHAMSNSLGYDFDKVQLKRGAYSPRAFGDQEAEMLTIRHGLSKVLMGEIALPMEIRSVKTNEEDAKRQEKVQEKLLEYMSGKVPLKVILINKETTNQD